MGEGTKSGNFSWPYDRSPVIDFYSEGSENEIGLMESLFHEMIQIYGMDCVYIPAERRAPTDYLFGENLDLIYRSGFPVRLYTSDTEDYQSAQLMFNKFGIMDTAEISFYVVQKDWWNKNEAAGRRIEITPGDIIFVPRILRRGFEVTYYTTEPQGSWHTFGKEFVYQIFTRIITFSHEEMQTGIPELDQLNDMPPNAPGTPTEDGIDTEKTGVVDFSDTDPFGEIGGQ
jgi:hypothetical protein